MAQKICTNRVVIQPGFYIFASLALLLLPVRGVFGWFAAVFFHELSHYLVLRLCKVSVFQVTISVFGAQMQTGVMSLWQEMISALAGPMGSLLLLVFMRICPYLSICAVIQALFNLIPIYPMDGGRVVRGVFIVLLGEQKGMRASAFLSRFLLTALVCVSLYIFVRYKLGVMPVAAVGLIVLRTIKIPCKERELIVQ